MATTTGVFLPDEQEQQISKKSPQSVRANGDGRSQSTLPLRSASELKKLDEEELKAAIKSAWKKHERIAKKDMGPLLYWLRDKLRAQGSRNDLHDRDKGFSAWVEKTIEISRRTADRWADEYGLANGLMKRKRKSTSGHVSKSFTDDPDEAFYAEEMERHGRGIKFSLWLSKKDHKEYQQALKIIQKHFGLENENLAVWKGVLYAAGQIKREVYTGAVRETEKTQTKLVRAANRPAQRANRNAALVGGRGTTTSSDAPDRSGMQGTNGHGSRKGPESSGKTTKPKTFRAAAG